MKLQGIYAYIRAHKYILFRGYDDYVDLTMYNNATYTYSDEMIIAESDFGIYGLLPDDNLVILDENKIAIRNVDIDVNGKISTLFLDLIYADR